jgi:hypothetical protein
VGSVAHEVVDVQCANQGHYLAEDVAAFVGPQQVVVNKGPQQVGRKKRREIVAAFVLYESSVDFSFPVCMFL